MARRGENKGQAPGASVILSWLAAVAVGSASAEGIDFAANVRPILESRCIRCHQPGNAKGGVSLATSADLVAGEYVAAGRPDDSGIFELIESRSPGSKPRMPKQGEPLTPNEIGILRRWIAEGAVWPADVVLKDAGSKRDRDQLRRTWWSLQPISRPDVPDPIGAPKEWRSNPIDRFLYVKMREKGLSPSPPANESVWKRRVAMNLTGLTPEAVAMDPDFPPGSAADATSLAYVDRLLASPRYGEHWGRHWLDVVRFGESNGYERNVLIDGLWPFRDYVIRSFNDDKPFDRMIAEHLAGDALGKGDPAVEAGVAFLVCGPFDDVGNQDPAQAAQIRADSIDEMIRTTSEAFLGLTIGCARCHDHKFDPIQQTDYYRLFAAFAGVGRGSRVVASEAARQEDDRRRKPLIAERDRLTAELRKLEAGILARIEPRRQEIEAKWVRPAVDRFFTEERFGPVDARWVRLVALARDDDANARTHFHIDEFEVWTGDGSPANVALASAGGRVHADSRVAEDFRGAYGPEVVNDGKLDQRLLCVGDTLTIELQGVRRIERVVFSSDRQKALRPGHPETRFIGEYRIEVSVDGKEWRPVASTEDRRPSTAEHRSRRLLQLARTAADRQRIEEIENQRREVERSLAAIPPLPQWWVGNFSDDRGPFHVFVGGDPGRRGESVAPGPPEFVEFLPPRALAPNATSGERRIAIAEWIASVKNPLTARLLANRVWQQHFGVGLVETSGDFGVMGAKPTHPELLDWLAGRIIESEWRLKPIHRLIATSAAYRQASTHRPDQAAIDADSRFVWRFPPRRLAAEEIRDNMLAAAGKLDLRMGGPGFRLYRYLQDNVSTYVPLDRVGPETHRRAVYHQNARAARVDLLTDFDAPDCAFANSRRTPTTTPLQALTLLNHSFTMDMAERLADRVSRKAGGDAGAQVGQAFQLVYGRDPDPDEASRAVQLIGEHGLRALCRALFNSNEFLHLY